MSQPMTEILDPTTFGFWNKLPPYWNYFQATFGFGFDLFIIIGMSFPTFHPDRTNLGRVMTSSIFSERELVFMFAICRRPSVCRLSVCRLSVVWNVRAPYSGDWNFRQYFYAIWYLCHLWPSGKNFTEIVPGNPSVGGLNQRGVEKYSDFWPFQGYISKTVQDRR